MSDDTWKTIEQLTVDVAPADTDRIIVQKVGEELLDPKTTTRGALREGLAPAFGVLETDGVLVIAPTLIEFQDIHFDVTEPTAGAVFIALGTHSAPQHTGNVLPGSNQDLGDAYLDIGEIAAPEGPGAGIRRLFVDMATGKLSVRTPAGTTVSLEEAGGGGGAPTDATYIVASANGTLSAELVLGTAVIMLGTLASRPAAGTAGRLYYVTDSGAQRWTRDNGVSWDDTVINWAQIVDKPASFTPSAHTHNASDINAGTLASARLPAATTTAQGAVELATDGESAAGLAVQANDGRLSNARTPTAHNHAASEITSGTIATARLGSGTADSTKFLRGDQTWAVPAGGGGGGSIGLTETDGILIAECTSIELNEAHFDLTEPTAGLGYISLAAGGHGANQHSGNVLPGAPQNLGATYLDIGESEAPPAAPSSGVRRLYVDPGTGRLAAKTASGSVAPLEDGQPIARDSFTDADGTALTAHVPNLGPSWSEGTGGAAGYTIQSNRLSRTDQVIRHAFFDAGTSHVRLTVKVAHCENLVGLLVRRSSTAHYWEVFYDFANDGWQMSLVNGGADSFKGPLLPGNAGTIVLEAKGNQITAIGPGGHSHTETDATLGTNTQVGVILTGFGGIASTLDDVLVEDASGNLLTPGINQNVGPAYVDLAAIAAPANPPAGTRRLFNDVATGKVSARTSAGTTVSLEEQGGGGSLTVREVDGAPSVSSVATLEAQQPLLVVTNPSAGVARLARADPWSVCELVDEFMPTSTETGETGALNWGNVSTSVAALAAEDAHPGIIQISTPGTSGAIRSIHLGAAVSTQVLSPADVDRSLWICRRVAGDQMMARFGFMRDASDTGGGTDGAYFRFDNVDGVTTQWLAVTRAAGVETVTNTTVVATAANWFQLELVRLSNGNWEFWINGALRATHSTNLPTAALNIVAAVETREALAKRIDVDAFYLRTKAIGQRWT